MIGFSSSLSAQLETGTLAPNFVSQDINGHSHELYKYLDKGKTVILEFSTAWCKSSWDYQQTNALNQVHELAGPDRLDNVVILFIESEPKNNLDQLYGISGDSGDTFADNTQGNWVDHIQYPILDNSSVADLYKVHSFPSFYKICPADKRVYKMGTYTKDELLNTTFDFDCMPPKMDNDIAILQYSGTTSICSNMASSVCVELVNLGAEPSENSSLQLEHNGEILTIQALPSLTAYERKTSFISLPELSDPEEISFTVLSGNDENNGNNSWSQKVQQAPINSTNEVIIEFFADRYAFELYWELRDTDGNTYASGGNEEVGINGGGFPYINASTGTGAYEEYSWHADTISLPAYDNCYELIVVDDFGDGICCTYGEGYYQIKNTHGETLIKGGQFSDYIIESFSVQLPTSTSTLTPSTHFDLFPNPATDYIQVHTNTPSTTSTLDLFIYDAFGKLVDQHRLKAQEQTLTINTSAYISGMYYLHVLDKNTALFSSKFVVF